MLLKTKIGCYLIYLLHIPRKRVNLLLLLSMLLSKVNKDYPWNRKNLHKLFRKGEKMLLYTLYKVN